MDRILEVINIFPYLLVGTITTLEITALTLALGIVLGIPVALLRVYGNAFFSYFAFSYSHLLRTIPVILIIFIFYFAVTRVVNLSGFAAACLALGIRSSAYQAEIYRGAIQSISSGQLTAARAQGMSKLQGIIYVIIPQALRLSVTGWTNEAAVVLKDSSFAFAVGVPELFRRATYVGARTFEPLTAYLACAIIYLVLTYAITSSTQSLGQRRQLRSEIIE